jgi:hypothetical protein
MAKKTKNSSLNSSIRQNTAATDAGFDKILAQQEQSLNLLRDQFKLQQAEFSVQQHHSLRNAEMLDQLGKIAMAGITDARVREENLQKEKQAAEESAKVHRQLQILVDHRKKQKEDEKAALEKEIELKQKAIQEAIRLNKIRAEEAAAISNIAKNMQTFKTMGDRLSDTSKKLKDNFGSMSALKTTALKAFNIGGIFNKSIAKEKFIKQQRALGSEDDRKTLSGKFESANKAAKDIKENEKEISRYKITTIERRGDLTLAKKRVLDIEKEFISLPLESMEFSDVADVAAAISIYRGSRGLFYKTFDLLGCNISEAKEHLEKQFKEGMIWENHGTHGWHIDHIIPCASFDLTYPEQQKKCFHYTNLQPLWAKENMSKGSNII